MKKYDFDKVIDRKNTGCIKYDSMEQRGLPLDVLPLWVADMDFRVADPIIDAMKDFCDYGIFGYSDIDGEYYDVASSWFERRFNWKPKKDWLITTPGVVFALNVAIRAFSKEGEAVMIQPPVYYPFFEAIENNNRKLIESPLILKDGRYEMDLADFEQKIIDNDVKIFILCSPHNPVGRVWTKDELKAVGSICKKHNVYIMADEIHCDFTWEDNVHTMFLDACPECSDIAISCTAPSKTFNLAGLHSSNIWIPSEEVRKMYLDALAKTGFFTLNIMGIVACRAAYAEGEEWFDQAKDYIYNNYVFMKEFISERLPMLKVMELQGTYLVWVDFSGLGLSPKEVDDLVVNKAKLWLDQGKIFGEGGDDYQRFVIACPRKTLEEALIRLEKAINDIK